MDEKLRKMCEYYSIDFDLTRPLKPNGKPAPLGYWDFEGYYETVSMVESLYELPFPNPDREIIRERAERQLHNAKEWCDIINTFFHRLSGLDDAQGRKIYD